MSDTVKIEPYRAWLNGKNSLDTGTVAVTGDTWKADDNDSLYLYLDIRDCNNTVHLDFSVYKPKDVRKRLKKVKKLATALVKIRNELERY